MRVTLLLLLLLGLFNISLAQQVSERAACANGIQFNVVVKTPHNGQAISCNGNCDAIVEITVTGGGGGPYGFQMYDGSITITKAADVPGGGVLATFSGLCADNYNFTVVDSSQLIFGTIFESCTEFGVIINDPNNIGVNVLGFQDPSCPDSCDGRIFANIGGGTSPLSIMWLESGSTLSSPTGVCTGINTVEVTDANGCFFTTTVSVDDPSQIDFGILIQDVTCDGVCDAQITSSPTGSNGGPFNFTWTQVSNGSGIGAASNVPSHTIGGLCETLQYQLDLEDVNGCPFSTTVAIPDVLPMTLTETFSAPATCANLCDGQITISISGGSGNYTQIEWFEGTIASPIGSFSSGPSLAQSDICPNTDYFVTVSDDQGCTRSFQLTPVTAPPAFTFSEIHSDVTCNGDGDGNINTTLGGGTPGYTYNWTTVDGSGLNATAPDQSSLSGGTYHLVYTDFKNCKDSIDIIILEPEPIYTNGIVTHVSCFDQTDGNISVTTTGGNGGYSWTWTSSANGNISDPSLESQSGLDSAIYLLHIVDNLGCTYDTTFNLGKPGELYFGALITQVDCFGDNDAIISLNPANGVPNYIIDWNNPLNIVNGSTTQTGLSADTYDITLTDNNGCDKDTSIIIIEPDLITLVLNSSTDVSCFGFNDGEIDVTTSGGTLPVTLTWSGGTSSIDPNETNPVDLGPGVYTATLTDVKGCTTSLDVTINEPAQLSLSMSGTDLTCNGVANGAVTIVPSGGVVSVDYTYDWDNDPRGDFDDTQNLSLLLAGTYCVNIMDDNGCTLAADSCISLIEPDSIFFNGSIQTDITCNGDNDGAVSLNVSGGTVAGGYSFNWNPVAVCYSGGTSSANISGLCPGSYTVTATDDNGCTNDTTFTIIEPNLLDLSEISHLDITCFGFDDGEIALSLSGGTAPTTVVWSGVIPSPINNNLNPTSLVPGNYTATVTDNNGCTDVVNVTINEPASLAITITGTDLTCNGVPDGTISTNPSGGTVAGNYTYSWTGPNGFTSTSQNLNSLFAGTYCMNFQDDNGCILTPDSCFVINEPDSIFFNGSTHTDITCFGDDDGSISLSVSGGTVAGNYGFNWSPVPACYAGNTSIASINNLCPGDYTVTAMDDNGCINDTLITIIEPLELTISESHTNLLCAGANTGDISITVSGGIAPTNVTWTSTTSTTPIANDLNPINLEPGDYTACVTDANGCQTCIDVTITTPTPLSLTLTGTDLSCNGVPDGTITANPSGGTVAGSYSFSWTGPNGFSSSSQNLNSLFAGTYCMNFQDDNGCVLTPDSCITINEPDSIHFNGTLFSDMDCFGADNATIDLTVTGGTVAGNYGVSWTGPGCAGAIPSTLSLSNLCDGNYSVTITDDNGCINDTSFVVTEPIELTIITSSTNAGCGLSNGSVNVIPSGGTIAGNYGISWSGAFTGFSGNNATESNLDPDTYTVTVSDDNGCSVTDNVDVNTATPPTVILDNLTDLLCNSVCNGAIQVSISVTNPPYTVQWVGITDPLFTSTSEDIFNLCAGDYSLQVTDINSCSAIQSFTISEPTPLEISNTNVTNVDCFGNATGAIDITPAGGTVATTYNYTWSGDNSFSSVVEDASGLLPGNYCVNISDDNGCSLAADSCFVITEPTELVIDALTSTDSQCGVPNGSATVSVSGGTVTGNYSYNWYNNSLVPIGQTTATASNLLQGTYIVEVTDDNGCTVSGTAAVNPTNGPAVTIDGFTDVTCAGANDGSIQTTGSGGSGVLNYSWDTSPTTGGFPGTDDVSGLSGGTYVVTVTDGALCNSQEVIVIDEPDPIVIVAAITDANCFGSNGDIDITVSGGTIALDYQYDWDFNGGASFNDTEDVTLPAGTYNVSVIDDHSCLAIGGPYTINEPTDISLSTSSTTSACTQSTGTVSVIAADGTPGNAPNEYLYIWTDLNGIQVGNSATASNLPAGCYDVQITENRPNGCITTTTECISDNPGPTLSETHIDATCNGGNDGSIDLTVVSSLNPVTISWSSVGGSSISPSTSSEDITTLASDQYSVIATDNNGCISGLTVAIDEPNAVSLTANITSPLCTSSMDGIIDILPIDAVLPLTSISWSGPNGFTSTNQTISGLSVGQYCVTVIDANGCQLDTCLTLTAPNGISVTTSSVSTDCIINTGEVSANAIGGIPNYTYQWFFDAAMTNPLPSSGSAQTNLGAAIYYLMVTDNNGCTATAQEEVQTVDGPIISIDAINDVDCFGNSSGDIFISVSGGSPNYTYDWDNLVGSNDPQDQTGLATGTYVVTVTDAAGCAAVASASIAEPNAALGISGITSDLECNAISTGEISITVTGGTPNYSYTWTQSGTSVSNSSNATGLNTVTGLAALQYDVTVTDDNGCTISDSYTLAEPTSITLSMSNLDASCGNSDGEVSVIASGGTDGITYTYDWINFSTSANVGATATISNLPQGTYQVTVQDLNGCSSVDLATISDIGGPTVTGTSTSVNCFGDSNGTIDITVTGNPNFGFSWVGPNSFTSVIEDINGLEAGSYAIAVTDINGCVTNDVYTIDGPLAPLAAITDSTNLACFNDQSGEIDLTVSGGTSPYTYSWSGPNGFTAITEDILGLDAGIYSVDITDNNGCSLVGVTTEVIESDSLEITFVTIDPSCGLSDGTVTATVIGGTVAIDYSYVWTDLVAGLMPDTDADITNIDAGNYQLDVTDDNGCSASQVVSVSNDQAPSITTNSTDVSCNGFNDGSIDITMNGTNTYTYDWDNNGTGSYTDTEDLSNLAPGTYNVEVLEDPTGCISTASVIITEPDLLTISGNGADLACFGDGSGDIDITVSGGTLNYNYDWDNLSGTNDPEDQTGLASGTYQITVTDANGCIAIDSYTLLEPSEIDVSAVIANNNCFGETNGSIDITVSNGVSPYAYSWDLPSTNEDLTNLSAGVYLLTITDANGCSKDSLFTITEPNAIVFNASVTDANCNISDGSITTNVSGGTLTSVYTYNWQFGGNSIAATANIVNQPAGTYTFTVTDDNLCSEDTLVVINNINAPIITLNSITDVICFGDANGSIDVSISGGTSPYTYLWNPNGIAQTEDLSNAPADTYSIQVTDASGCLATLTNLVIDSPDEITTTITPTDATCGICNGEATVLGSGGTGSISYLWSTGNTTDTETGLCSGVYTVQINDASGCSINEDVTINDIGGPTGEIIATTDATCSGDSDGSATVTATGGTSPYNYYWPHNGSTNAVQSTLSAGTYNVEMMDNNGCIRVASVDILEPSDIVISSNVNPSTCGNADGDITITVSGGVSPLTINWINPAGQTTPGVFGLSAGVYTVMVTDANGCSKTKNISISDVNAPSLTLTPTDALCNGDATGSITSSISGAIGAISYQWYDQSANIIGGETNSDILNVSIGDYTLEITDAGTGCISNQTATIQEPDALMLSLPNVVDASCSTSCDGQATAVVSGGTLAYSYQWSSGATSATATNLCSGINTVTITDNNGCVIQSNVTIDENFTLSANVTPTDATCGLCNGSADVVAAGGSGSYSINWSNGTTSFTANNLCSGLYPFEVVDNTSGCSVQMDATINDIGGPTGETINTTDVTCFNGNDGGATVLPVGGVTPYQYSWIGLGNNTNTISNQSAGTYSLQVSDDNGCVRIVPVTISEPLGMDVQYIAVDGTCGNADGSITIVVTGTSAPFTYSWISGPSAVGSINDSESGLLPGIYTIEVTDNSGCVETVNIPLGSTNGPSLTTTSNDESCNNFGDGQAEVVANGNGPFTYAWTSGGINPIETNLSEGQYFVTVTDALGCVSNASVDISAPDQLALGIPTVNDASCDIACDGSATIIVTGGTLGYSYAWNSGQTNQTASGLCVGVNSVNITDANGCQIQTSITVDYNNTLASTIVETDATCGLCDGQATVSGSGGSGNYTISWYDGTTGTNHTDLCAGIYPYSITDNANGCSSDLEATINNIGGPDSETVTTTDVTCLGGSDGTADVTVTGGTLPYTYLWVPTGQTTNTITNLGAGTYNLEVSDSNDCKRVVPVTINDGNEINVNYVVTGSNCGNSDGSFEILVSGGITPYIISWNGPGGSSGNTTIANGLSAGIYSVNVTDNNGCTQTVIIPLGTTDGPTASVSTSNISCFGLNDGGATVSGSGLDFEWQDGSTSASLSNLPAGQYFVIATDQGTGCSSVFSGIVNEPDSISLGIQFAQDPLCNGDCNGEISAIVDGGTLPYSYSWSSSTNTTATESGLCSGLTTLTITDNNGCLQTGDVTLTEPTVITITIDNIVDAQCINSQDGSVDISVSGGSGIYTYSWSTIPTGTFTSTAEDISGLDPMTYEVSVTDDNGCNMLETAVVDTLTIVVANAGLDTALCINNCVVISGSYNSPVTPTMEWNSLPNTTVISTADTVEVCPLISGVSQYTFTITALNCTHTDTINVEIYPLPVVNAGSDIEAVLSSVQTLGGTPTGPTGSTYYWTPNTNFVTVNDSMASNPQIELLDELDYFVFVTDTNGCTNSDTIHVRPIPQIVFPNGFTPNGDGVNDDWQIDYIDQFPECEVEVYNRWGEMLFYSKGYTKRWDGTYDGKDLPVGTYYYIIELNDPLFPDTYSGPLTIMR